MRRRILGRWPGVRRVAGGGPELIEALCKKCHQVKDVARDAGSAHLIAREGELWRGVAETRMPNAAAIVA